MSWSNWIICTDRRPTSATHVSCRTYNQADDTARQGGGWVNVTHIGRGTLAAFSSETWITFTPPRVAFTAPLHRIGVTMPFVVRGWGWTILFQTFTMSPNISLCAHMDIKMRNTIIQLRIYFKSSNVRNVGVLSLPFCNRTCHKHSFRYRFDLTFFITSYILLYECMRI